MSGKEIWAEADWYFSLDRQIVQTVVDKTAGTVDVSAGGTTVTGTSTACASTNVGSFIQFSSSNDWYKITAVAGATSLTIEIAYVGTSNLDDGTYTIRRMFYSLGSTVEKLLSARQAISPTFIDMLHYRDFDIYRPNPTSTGNPDSLVVYGLDSSGNMQFTLYPFPSAIENIEVRFKKLYTDLSADSDTSSIPAKWHETVMIDGAIWRAFQYQSTGQAAEETRAMFARKRFESGLAKMLAQQDIDTSRHDIIVARDQARTTLGPILPYKYGS